MRPNPFQSETDASRLTIALAARVLIAVFVGWFSEPLVGGIVFVALALAALATDLRLSDRGRRLLLREAAHEPHPHGAPPGRRHVLVIANKPLEGGELREHIRGLDGARTEVDVLAPVLSSRAHLAYTDIDKELSEAHRRLARSLAWVRAQGFVARGEVGDPSPTTAIEDELRDFGADEVIVVARGPEATGWQEQTELARLCDELDVPVVHVAGERER